MNNQDKSKTSSKNSKDYKISINNKNDYIRLAIENKYDNTEYRGIFGTKTFTEKYSKLNNSETIIKLLENAKSRNDFRIEEEKGKILKTYWKIKEFEDIEEIELKCKRFFKVNNIEELNEKLEERLSILDIQNSELIKNNKDLIDINLRLMERINLLESKIDCIISFQENKIKEEKENERKYFKGKGLTKKIIKNIEEAKQLQEWILPNKNRKFELLFDPSKDGDKREDFRKKCLNKGSWLFIAESIKGRRFGGYTTVNLCKKKGEKDKYKYDPNSFLFSFDNNKVYRNISKNHSICDSDNYGIWFGNGANIGIDNNFLTGEHSEDYSSERCYDVPKNGELTGGQKFKLTKLEVYQVLEE